MNYEEWKSKRKVAKINYSARNYGKKTQIAENTGISATEFAEMAERVRNDFISSMKRKEKELEEIVRDIHTYQHSPPPKPTSSDDPNSAFRKKKAKDSNKLIEKNPCGEVVMSVGEMGSAVEQPIEDEEDYDIEDIFLNTDGN